MKIYEEKHKQTTEQPNQFLLDNLPDNEDAT